MEAACGQRDYGGMSFLALVLVIAGTALATPAPAGANELVYKGCISGYAAQSGESLPVDCTFIDSAPSGYRSGLGEVVSLALSPDGTSLYAAWPPPCKPGQCLNAGGLASFARDPEAGELAYAGCLTGDTDLGPEGSGACEEVPGATANGLGSGFSPGSLAMAPDGRFLYAASHRACETLRGDDCHGSNALSWLGRDGETGELTYDACITGDERSGTTSPAQCAEVPGTTADGWGSGLSLGSAVISPDGAFLYTESATEITTLSLAPDGSPTLEGCLTGDEEVAAEGACTAVPNATEAGWDSGLGTVRDIALSADGTMLYAAMGDSVAWLERNPLDGELTYGGCLTGDSSRGPDGNGSCEEIPAAAANGTGSGLAGADDLVASATGDLVFVAAANDAAIATFARDPESGVPSFSGCVTSRMDVAGPEGTGACRALPNATRGSVNPSLLDSVEALEPSPDGRALYANGRGLASLAIDQESGSLGLLGCLTTNPQLGPDGSRTCRLIERAPLGVSDLVASGDGNSLYGADPGLQSVTRLAVAPQTAIAGSKRSARPGGRAVAFKFAASEPSRFECRLRGRVPRPALRRWRRCGPRTPSKAGSVRYADISKSRVRFLVRATDTAGTTDPTPAERRWAPGKRR